MEYPTKDSGQRREFPSGSRRDVREGKGRFDLLPFYGIKRLAGLYERGAVKYGDRNWEKGQPLSSYADSTLRHAFAASAGFTDEDHWAAVAWNALAVIDHQERIAQGHLPAELDDLPTPYSLPTPAPTTWVASTLDDVTHDVGPHECSPLHAATHWKEIQ